MRGWCEQADGLQGQRKVSRPRRPETLTWDIITDDIRAALARNGERATCDPAFDPAPIVKLFTPDANATWLLAWTEPDEPDIAFGLCDLGLGFPELGSVRLSEIAALHGRLGLPVERDLVFRPDCTLSAYADEARRCGAIVA